MRKSVFARFVNLGIEPQPNANYDPTKDEAETTFFEENRTAIKVCCSLLLALSACLIVAALIIYINDTFPDVYPEDMCGLRNESIFDNKEEHG